LKYKITGEIKGGMLINQSTENQELEDEIMNIGWAEVVSV